VNRSRAIIGCAAVLALVTLVATFVASGWWRLLNPLELGAHYRAVAGFARLSPVAALGLFMVASAAVTAACLPATGVLVVLGGALFGPVPGGVAALIGSVMGSTGVFLACRAASHGWFTIPADGRISRIMTALSRHTFSTLLVLRLTPVAPLSVVNIAAGFARVALGPFLAASLIGSAPSNLIYAALGSGLAQSLDRGEGFDSHMLTSPRLLAPLFALAVLAGATAVINVRRRRSLLVRRG